jgi:hypothetical protein
MPTGSPAASRAVTIVTPVANMPRAARNWMLEKGRGAAFAGERGIVRLSANRSA